MNRDTEITNIARTELLDTIATSQAQITDGIQAMKMRLGDVEAPLEFINTAAQSTGQIDPSLLKLRDELDGRARNIRAAIVEHERAHTEFAAHLEQVPPLNALKKEGEGDGDATLNQAFDWSYRRLTATLLLPVVGSFIGSFLQKWALNETWPACQLLRYILGSSSGPSSASPVGLGATLVLPGFHLANRRMDPVW